MGKLNELMELKTMDDIEKFLIKNDKTSKANTSEYDGKHAVIIFDDGEVVLTKAGKLFLSRNFHTVFPSFIFNSEYKFKFPNEYGDYSYVVCDFGEAAMKYIKPIYEQLNPKAVEISAVDKELFNIYVEARKELFDYLIRYFGKIYDKEFDKWNNFEYKRNTPEEQLCKVGKKLAIQYRVQQILYQKILNSFNSRINVDDILNIHNGGTDIHNDILTCYSIDAFESVKGTKILNEYKNSKKPLLNFWNKYSHIL